MKRTFEEERKDLQSAIDLEKYRLAVAYASFQLAVFENDTQAAKRWYDRTARCIKRKELAEYLFNTVGE